MTTMTTKILSVDLPIDKGTIFKYLHYQIKNGGRSIIRALPAPDHAVKHIDVHNAFITTTIVDENRIECLGGGLIVVDHKEKVITLSHYSAMYGPDRNRAGAVRTVQEYFRNYAVAAD